MTDFTLDHVGVLRARQVEEFDAVELDAGRRQQRQTDRTIDDDVTTRCALHLRHDLGLVGIDVDEHRQGQQRNDQQADEASGPNQKPVTLVVCHGPPPLPNIRILAHPQWRDTVASVIASLPARGTIGPCLPITMSRLNKGLCWLLIGPALVAAAAADWVRSHDISSPSMGRRTVQTEDIGARAVLFRPLVAHRTHACEFQ